MFAFLKKLFSGDTGTEEFVPNLDRLSPPPKKAIARRNRAVQQAIESMGDKYMAVPFKKLEEAPKLAEVTKIRKTA